MMKISKKRIVLFLLFIFPLMCFLLLSTGKNNFAKLPVVTKNILDISVIDATKTFKNHVSVICFLGEQIDKNKGAVFNLNEKIYKKFIEYKKFQIIAIYPKGRAKEVEKLKKEIQAFTDMKKWNFIEADKEKIEALYSSLKTEDSLFNGYSSMSFLVDRNGDLRGRVEDEDSKDGRLFGYNMKSVAILGDKMEDDINVLFYEYYAAFKEKNKNKATRKEIGR